MILQVWQGLRWSRYKGGGKRGMLTLNPTQYSSSPCVYNDTGPKNEKPPIRFLLLVGLCLFCQQEKCIFLGPRFFRVFLTWDKWSSASVALVSWILSGEHRLCFGRSPGSNPYHLMEWHLTFSGSIHSYMEWALWSGPIPKYVYCRIG
jgi:hypothetical protein